MAGCGILRSDSDTVVIGSKNFTEQLVLGEMYAQLLDTNDIKVKRKLNLGSTAIAHSALTKGEIQLYPNIPGRGCLQFSSWKRCRTRTKSIGSCRSNIGKSGIWSGSIRHR